MLIGIIDENNETIYITRVENIINDARQKEPYKSFMDKIVKKYAMPCPYCSDEDRGFVIPPEELLRVHNSLRNEEIIGFYHMHCCDLPKVDMSIPHKLDVALHKDRSLLSFIVDLTKPESPKIRAFRIVIENDDKRKDKNYVISYDIEGRIFNVYEVPIYFE